MQDATQSLKQVSAACAANSGNPTTTPPTPVTALLTSEMTALRLLVSMLVSVLLQAFVAHAQRRLVPLKPTTKQITKANAGTGLQRSLRLSFDGVFLDGEVEALLGLFGGHQFSLCGGKSLADGTSFFDSHVKRLVLALGVSFL